MTLLLPMGLTCGWAGYWRRFPSSLCLALDESVESVSHSVMSDSATPWTVCRLLCPWDSPGKNIGVSSHFLLQGIFPTQGSNPGLLYCRQIFYHLNPWGFNLKENCNQDITRQGLLKRNQLLTIWSRKEPFCDSSWEHRKAETVHKPRGGSEQQVSFLLMD